jgi:hypothetical protein
VPSARNSGLDRISNGTPGLWTSSYGIISITDTDIYLIGLQDKYFLWDLDKIPIDDEKWGLTVSRTI